MEWNILNKVLAGVGIALVIYSIVITILYFGHECPELPKEVELQEKYVEQIKEISHAKPEDIDSLLHVYYPELGL